MTEKLTSLGLIFFLAAFLFSCADGKQQFEIGMKLSKAGKHTDAISYIEQAIVNEPNNVEYQKALSDIKEILISDYISQISKAMGSKTQITMTDISSAKAKLAKLKEIDPNHPYVKKLSVEIDRHESLLLSQAKNLYAQAKSLISAGEWHKAYFNLQQIQGIFPNYEDSSQQLHQTAYKGSEALYGKARTLFEEDDFRGALKHLNEALSLKPDHKPSIELIALVKERDNKNYFIDNGKKAEAAKDWSKALKAYKRALEYSPGDESLTSIVQKLGTHYIRTANSQMSDGWLFKAFESYSIALKNASNPDNAELRGLCSELASQAGSVAAKLKEQGKYGSAWFWYSKIKSIKPDHTEIFSSHLEMEDKIKQRVQKSIAVFDFSSPSGYKDAGIIVANNLITYLFKNASGDIKILERENLKSILEEMKLGQIGVVSEQTAKEMGRVYGIDVAVMGSVLLYQVETSTSQGTKTVRYQVGTEIQDNIDYLNWVAKNPNPTPALLSTAPPAKIAAPKYTEKDYVVSNHKKVGFVQLSFRIVDVRTGENIQVRTIERKEVVEDDTSAGLPEANVKFDPLTIPTDTELLQKMTGEVVAELGREALKPLNNLEKTYFQAGEQFIKRRERIQAAESFVDAIFDEKMKMIQESPLSLKAMDNLEDIFRNYKEN